jgi:uncharacterized membrane protein
MAAAIAVPHVFPDSSSVVQIVVGILVYGILLAALRVVGSEDLQLLRRLLIRRAA